MPIELSDDEVFGAKEMSDDEVFGGAELSDDEVFGKTKPLSEAEYGSLMGRENAPAVQPPKNILAPSDLVRGFNPEVAGVGGGNLPQPTPDAKALLGSPIAMATSPFTMVGKPLNAAASDLGAALGTTVAGEPAQMGAQGGNLLELFTRDEPWYSSKKLPQQEVLADISKTHPTIATTGKIAGGLVESAPMLVAMPQGAVGKLIAAGFTVDMLNAAGESATQLGDELGKPPEQRNYDNITTALSGIIQSAGFAPLTGAHAGGKFIGERVAPKAEAIRELAKALKQEPMSRPTPLTPQRQLGVRIPEGEFAQPGILPLADAALREAQKQTILAPGEQPAIDVLRNAINQPRVDLVDPTRLAERVQGGGEAPYGKVSYRRGAEDLIGLPRNASAPVRAENATTPNKPSAAARANLGILDLGESGIASRAAKPTSVSKSLNEGIAAGLADAESALPSLREAMEVRKSSLPSESPQSGNILSKNLGDLLESISGDKKAFEPSDANASRVVQSVVDRAMQDPEIANSIVSLVPVDVVNMLATKERPSEMLLNNPAMLIDSLSVNRDPLVTGRFYGILKGLHELNKNIDAKPSQDYAIYSKGSSVLRNVREEPIKGQGEMPGEIVGRKADVGGSGKGEAKTEVNLEQKIDSGDIADLGKVQHSTGIEYGLKLPKEDLPRIQAKYDDAGKKWIEAAAKNDNAEALKQGYRHTFYGGTLMGITEGKHPISGSNFDLYAKQRSSPEFIAKEVGAKFVKEVTSLKDPNNSKWMFEDLKTQESFAVPKGSTLEQVRQKVESRRPEAEMDVESVTPLDPASGSPKSSIAPLIEKMDARLAQIQEKIRKGFYKGHTAMGVPTAILDTALQAARLALKAGKPVAEAIEAAIKHIKFNVQKFNEAEVRKMFEQELGNAGMVEAGKKSSVGSQDVKAVSKTPEQTLTEVKKIFEPTKKPFPGAREIGSKIIEAFRTGVSSKFRPLNKLAEDIAKAYGLTSRRDIAGLMEQLKGSQGKAEADIYRFDRDVSKLVKGDEADFNSYVFLRRSLDRLSQDMKDINRAIAGEDVKTLNRRSVADYTINELNPALELLKAKLGPEKVANFEKAAEAYQRHMDQALRLQVESGRMSPEVYDAIKKGNEFYAPFKVMKYIEEQMRPEGSGRKIDTVADYTKAMKGIEDPNFKLGDMLAAARQGISMSRILADKNNAMRAVAELAAFDPNGTFIKKLGPDEAAPKGMEAVNVLEGGNKVRYAIDEGAAQSLAASGGKGGAILLKAMALGAVPFRAGATALNLPFQVSNLLADVPRQALVSKYGIRGVNDLWRYPADFVQSLYSSIAGDVFGKDNKLFLDFLDSGVAGTTVQEYLTPNALKFQESTRLSQGKKMASSVINLIPEFAKAIEQTSKVMGVKRAMRFEGVTSGKELAAKIPEAVTELRRFSGSPDFGRQGSAIEAARLNMLYMFLNARIQGAVADIGRLSGRDGAKTAARTWQKLAFTVGLATAYGYWMNNRDEYKEDYAKIPAREKQNYWHIPKDSFITTDDGERIRDYWRIPKRETAKWIANFTESAINFAEKRDPKAAKDFATGMIQEVTPVNIQGDTAQERLESVASGTHPFIKSALELATGRDLYRHRSIVPDAMKEASPEQQFKPSTSEAYKKLAEAMPDVAPEFLRSPLLIENLTRNMTAGLITQFLPRKPMEGRGKIENLPLLARFQAPPYTDNAQFKQDIGELKREAADESLARHRVATKLIDDNKGKDLGEILDKAPQDEKTMRLVADLWIAKQNGITFQERQLLSLPTAQRASYVANQLRGMSPAEQEQKIMELARKRILTEDVFEQLPEAMK